MKFGIVIIARNSSSRLHGKVLKKIKDKTILQYIIDRVTKVVPKENVVIATSEDASDDLIEYFCKEIEIDCYRGDLQNVSKRFLDASDSKNFDYAIRINGDNLFVDIPTLKEMIEIASEKKYDFISNVKGRTFPRGMSVEIVKTSFYKEMYNQFSSEDDFEHVTKYIYDNMDDKIFVYENKTCPEAANIQMAIDSQYDFILAEHIINCFTEDHTAYNLPQIYKLYEENLYKMNFVGKYGPVLIAEIGGNHEGDFEYAKKLTQLAIESDADYIKFQLYTGDTLVNPVLSPDRNKHFKKFELSKDQYIELAEMVTSAGKRFMASVWDVSMLEWIDQYMPVYKIGSGDLMAWPLLKKIAQFNKPIILSTGLATEKDVVDTVNFIQSVNPLYKDEYYLSVLQCTSMYPIPFSASNLNVMDRLKELLSGVTIGYSDHTIGLDALAYSVAMGAKVLEFHFTDTREGKEFRDHKVSLTRDEVHVLIQKIKDIYTLKGDPIKQPTEIEKMHDYQVSFRRGVFPAREIKKGEVLTEEDLVILRPDIGISSQYFYNIIGKKTKQNLTKYQVLNWALLEC